MRYLIFLACLSFSSCAIVYYPNSRNVPMFSSKGEFQGSVTTGTGNNLQLAYAVTNHFGVMSNGMLWGANGVDKNHINQHRYGEAGVGYYNNYANKMFMDIWGGYGIGNVNAVDSLNYVGSSANYNSVQGNYQKFFIQPSFGFKTEDIGIAFANRFSWIDFSGLSHHEAGAPALITQKQQLFYEPSVVFKVFIKEFYFTTQGGFNIPLGKIDENIRYKALQLSFGIGCRLNFKKASK